MGVEKEKFCDNISNRYINMIHRKEPPMAREKKIDMVILGLLSHEDRTGYDIKKQIDGAISFFWKGSFGNIYPTLKELEEGGLVKRAGTSEGGREKILYSITDAGRESLREWLKNGQATNELRYETLLKMFFGGNAGREEALANIGLFEAEVRQSLAILNMYCSNLEKVLDVEDHVYFYLTASFGVETYEAYLKWCEKAKKMLSSKEIGK